MKPSDVFYDMGCGDATLLIYAVKKCGLERAVGFENMQSRVRRAKMKIREAALEGKIILENDMYDANLREADVILDMMPEGRDDLRALYSRKCIKNGTKLIKHDLPLVGYLPDKIEPPFYLMKFPLRKAKSSNEWASAVLREPNANADQLWHELYYYQHEKRYSKGEILQFISMLRNRVK